MNLDDRPRAAGRALREGSATQVDATTCRATTAGVSSARDSGTDETSPIENAVMPASVVAAR